MKIEILIVFNVKTTNDSETLCARNFTANFTV